MGKRAAIRPRLLLCSGCHFGLNAAMFVHLAACTARGDLAKGQASGTRCFTAQQTWHTYYTPGTVPSAGDIIRRLGIMALPAWHPSRAVSSAGAGPGTAIQGTSLQRKGTSQAMGADSWGGAEACVKGSHGLWSFKSDALEVRRNPSWSLSGPSLSLSPRGHLPRKRPLCGRLLLRSVNK